MNKLTLPISIVTGAFAVFTVLCLPGLSIPLGILFIFLFCLNVGLVWMVITVLKHETSSPRTFEQQFYEDYDYQRNTPPNK